MKKITLLLFMLLLAKYAISQTVVLNVQVFQDNQWASVPVYVEGASVTISNADILPNGATAITDASGIASFNIDQPTDYVLYDFEISKAGYTTKTKTGWGGIYVSSTTTYPYTSKQVLYKEYTASFTVTNDLDVAIPGAKIIVSSYSPEPDTLDTDVNGQAVFVRNASSGSQNYSISADGYADTTSTFNIDPNGTDVVVPTVKMKNAYSLTMTIQDASANPISNALVSLSGYDVTEELTTDENGQVFFQKKINGEYSYTVFSTGAVDEYGTVTVSDADPDVTITLTTGYDLTFTIINGESGVVGLQQDTITIDGNTKVSGTDGIITFGVAPGSSYSFNNVKKGFISVPVEIANIQENTNITIYMKPDYNLTINVVDFAEYTPLSGAKVTFNGNEVLTDVNGKAFFEHLDPSDTPYDYTVVSPEGETYKDNTGSISLPVASTSYLWDNNNISKTIVLEKTYAYIGLSSGWMGYYGAATINFDGVDYDYNTGLGGNFFYVDPGTYEYKVTPADEAMAIYSGTLTVTDTENAAIMISVAAGYNVEIYVSDSNQDAVEGATVTFNGMEVTTDASGLAFFPRVASGDYLYSVVKDGYTGVADQSLTVGTEVVTEVVTLLVPGYSITFNVTDGTNPIAGAVVSIDNKDVSTDALGVAVYSEMTDGTYNYTVTASGYEDVTSSIEVSGADITKDITMSLLSYTISFTVTDGTNPIDGAVVSIGDVDITANASGVAEFSNMINGTYNYTVSANGYEDNTGSVNVNDADVSENVSLTLLTYTITFTVTDGTDPVEGAVVSIGDVDVATDASGVAAFSDMINGTYDFTVVATDYYEYSSSVTVSDANLAESVALTSSVGVYNVLMNGITVYPNPTSDIIYLSFSTSSLSNTIVTITNMMGQEMNIIKVNDSTEEISFDLSDYSSGMYLIHVKQGENTSVFQVIRK